MEVTPTDYTVGSVTGEHRPGMTSLDVSSIAIFNNFSVTVMPKNMKLWFKNFIQLRLYDLPKFPEFSAGDFNELTHLTSFVASKLPLITKIPRDAFRDLTNLEVLGLNEMPNLENLHEDLLMYATKLEIFSARGPNKINQISPRFFRNQATMLQAVDFTNTKLKRISHNVFDKVQLLSEAYFTNAGCLNAVYKYYSIKSTFIQDIRKNCQNVGEELNRNSSSSSSNESK